MNDLKERVRIFAEERGWQEFHTPKNLVMALAGEVGELLEVFQWLTPEQSTVEGLSEQNISKAKLEIADVFLYLIQLADQLNIDLVEEANRKMDFNTQKYPVEVSKGNAIKYNRRDE